MSNIIKVNFFDEQTGEFQEGSILTSAEAVIMADGTTLEDKSQEFTGGVSGITMSSNPPSNPVDGQIWFEPVV